MEIKPTFKERVLEFFYSIGLPPIRLAQGAIFLAIIGVVTMVLFSMNFGSDDATPGDNNEAQSFTVSEDDTKREIVKSELTVDEQLDDLLFFNADDSFFTVASQIEERNQIIEELQQRNQLDPEQKIKIDRIQLANHQTMVIKMLNEGIKADKEVETLKQFCTSLLKREDPELRSLGAHRLAMAAATNFAFGPTEENFQEVKETLKTHRQSFLNDSGRVEELNKMIQNAKRLFPRKTYSNDAVKFFGDMLGESQKTEIQELGNELGEHSLFSKFDLATLENRIRYRDQAALGHFDGALRLIESRPESQVERWMILIKSSEAFLSTEQFGNATMASDIIGQLVAKLPESDQRRTKLLELLERQKIRTAAIGTPFNVSGTSVDGASISPSGKKYTLLVFANRNQQSREILRDLRTGVASRHRFRPIVAFADDFTAADREQFSRIPNGVTVASHESALKYAAALPIDFYPYSILIDKQGKVACGNLSLIQASNRVAKIESKERRERNPPKFPAQ